jgi:hypothetical protein
VAEQRYQAVLAVIKDGRTVTEVRPRPARINVYRLGEWALPRCAHPCRPRTSRPVI